ncbi:FG-GAP-like repeat-containing protein [Methylobacterium oryzihabitans]|uniref:Bacterial Ig-like domain-containing protein n=1 Tax=Methylobacterium oryzihabitans TaxID=2499852 RepID=A0A3S2WBW8_9HYPH|nr:FG-GAP-like repeat-containing protein [Methylobacterium oryzihabitans]RVU18718.1 hypothetical protein EOE48_10055 [Methylobacterium oryzihabitans]
MTIRFFEAGPVTTGYSPYSVTMADVNGDGRQDLLVANYNSGTVSVRLGRGDGTFTSATDVPTGSNPRSVTAADVNGDGRQDILVANNSSGTVSVRLGRGDGTFTSATDVLTGSNPRSVTTADVNGDGRQDLLVANYLSNTVSVRLGVGDGTFTSATDVPTGGGPISVTTADVNGDGRQDLLVANNASGTVSVRLGRGDGTFTSATDVPTGGGPISVTTADVNGDGRQDILVANYLSGTVSVRLGRGDGTFTFTSATDVATGSRPYSVTTADVNGDGRQDILVANAGSDTVSVRLGRGDGTFTITSADDVPTGGGPISVTTADVNGDGRQDLLVANEGSGTVSVLLGTNVTAATAIGASPGAGTVLGLGGQVVLTLSTETPVVVDTRGGTPFLTLSNGGQAVYSGTDGSGRPRFTYTAAAGQTTSGLTVTGLTLDGGTVRDPGETSFVSATDIGTGSLPRSVTTADVNGDGRQDILVANQGDGTVSVRLGVGDGTFTTATDVATGSLPISVMTADVNGDGRLDLLVANRFDDTVSVRLGRGDGTFTSATDVATGSRPISVTTADVNGDGRQDLLVANAGSGTVSVRLGVGDGTFTTATDVPTGSSPFSVTTADLNGDGRQDILVANNSSGTVSVRLGVGDGTFTTATDVPTGDKPSSVTTADVNGDGRQDLLVANEASGTVSVRLGVGDGTFTSATDVPTGDKPYSVTTADVNGDGWQDILVANFDSGTVSVRLGVGDGTFTTADDVPTGSNPASVTTADVNGDGQQDILVANFGSGTVSVHLNTSRPTASLDLASIASASGAVTGLAVDTTAPTVTGLTSTTPDGAYHAGDVIDIAVGFSEAVTVTGTPRLTLETGAVDRAVDYVSGSGTASLVFRYTVQPGDTAADLDALTLALAGGTIRDAAGNAAALALPAAGAAGSLAAAKALVVDTTTPTVTRLTSSTRDGTYRAGSVIAVQVGFSEAVTVTGTPRLTLETGTTDREATYARGSGTDTLTFLYTVQPGDSAADLDALTLGLAGGTIRDAASNDAALALPAAGSPGSLAAAKALVIDTAPPPTFTTAATAIGASAGAGTVLGPGGQVVLTLSTATPVVVDTRGGTPFLTLSNGGQAVYSGTDGGGRPRFTYTAAAGQDTSGLTVIGLTLDGGTVRDPGGTSFVSATDVITGAYPISVTTSDVNGDGRQDLLVANESSNTVSVRLGRGDGTFTSASDVITGSLPRSVTTADVNGDGRQDILVANYNSGTVSVRLGVGDGTFTSATDVATGIYPRSVTAADVNGDGRQDLLVANSNSDTVSVRLGVGDGTFTSTTDVATGNSPYSVTTADVNGDGRQDILVASPGSRTVSVRLGVGDGTFTSTTDVATGNSPYSVTTADVNGDGRQDILVANADSGTVSVRLGVGDGTFTNATDVATGNSPYSVTTADVNGDGQQDILVANRDSGTVSVRLGRGDGTFTSADDVPAGSGPISVTTADVNGDGRQDILVANYFSNTTVSVRLNTSRPTATFDLASIASASGAVTGLAVDATAPTVTGLTATTPDGAYGAGGVIDIAVGFSEAVTVTGTPRLTLETGATDRAVDYVSGSGTASLVFRYTVQPGDTAADLDALTLALNGGTIRDAAGNDAALALPAAGSPGSLAAAKALVIDTAAPAAPGLALAADTGASAVDRLTNDARLAVAAEPGASLRYRLDGAPETAAYDPAALADGTHTVTVTQTDAAGNVSAAASLAFTLDRTAPAVVAITPDTAGPTNAGTLTQTVTLSEAVTGLDAADFALVLTGSAAARIAGVSGSGATYTVTLADVTGDGTLRLDLAADGTGIQDLAGNAVAGGFAGGATILDHGVPGLTIGPVAGDGWISAAEHGTALVVAGTTTAEDGRTVTLGLAGRSYVATVTGGAWSVTVPGADVAALPDTAGTPLVLTADVSDRAGNPAVRATRSLAVDTTADAGGDAALTLDASADTVVNAAEARAVAFTLAGLDPDATAVATFSDGTTSRSLTLAGNGPGRLDLSGLDGTVTGTLTITDRLGNTVTRAGGTLVLDTVAPAAPGLALTHDTGPDAGDRVTADPRLTVTPAEAGGTLRTTVDGAAVAAYDPAALGPGAHRVEVVQVDAAGNASAPAGLAFTLVGYFETITGEGPGDLTLTGSDFADLIRGNAGDDTVRGGRGADYLHGLAGNDSVDGGLGNDTVFGDLGDDRVDGGAGDDQVRGWFGRDTLTGGDGNDGVFGEEDDDLLTGGSGDDYLSGGAGDDALSGEDGDDLLFGNAGNDELVGGAGRDRFAFGRGDGQDVIRDFVAGGAEADVIAFNNGAFADFAGVQAALRQAGADAVFAYGDGDTVTIRNLQASSLTAANFTFA